MVELIIGTYGVVCWLVLVKFKLLPLNAYTIFSAIAGGCGILLLLYILLSVYHPSSNDGRMYAPVVQIVPQVRGIVIEVPVEANKLIKKGDVLFRIDPTPYQIEIERLRALLAGKNRDFAFDVEALAAAEASTKEARAKLAASESTNDRQLRETYERAQSQVLQVNERLERSSAQYERVKEMLAKAVGSQQEFDRAEANFQSLQQEYSQAQTDEKLAKEKLKGGSSTLEADVQNLTRLEAQERQARARVNTRIEGGDAKEPVTAAITGWGILFSRPPVTPEVRETMAMLDKARWELEQTVVRAPTDGYVPQNVLRPGMMAVPIPIKPLMMYVVSEQPTLVASYPQKVIANIKPGMEGEATFKQYPGRTFKVKVRRVLTAVREGELDAGGQILTPTGAEEHGHIPVVFDYDEDISDLKLPVGAQASIAIYTDRVHALSFLRKIIIRIHSWENYVF